MRNTFHLCGSILLLTACTLSATSGEPPTASRPVGDQAPQVTSASTQPEPGNERLQSLMDGLVNVEQSIDAVNKALRLAGYKTNAASGKASDATKANERMDHNGGGPVNWRKFYGTTARDFATHRLKADVAWRGHNSEGSVHRDDAIGQLQRPKQFDYVYRANDKQAARAQQEVGALGHQKDALLARRRQLGLEQSALWAAVTFESIADRNISLRPLYRNELTGNADQADNEKLADARLAAMYASILSLRIIEHTLSQLTDDLKTKQEEAAVTLRDTLKNARAKVSEAAANFQQADGVREADYAKMKDVVELVKRLYGQCQDICDAYQSAHEGDNANDDIQKQFARGKLQRSMMEFGATVGKLDEQLGATAEAWGLRPEKGRVRQYELTEVKIMPATTPAAIAAPARIWTSLLDRAQFGGWSSLRGAIALEPESDGSVTVSNSAFVWGAPVHDVIIRAKVRKINGQNLALFLRSSKDDRYVAWFNGGNWFGIAVKVGKRNKGLSDVHCKQRFPGFFVMEFSAIGDQLILSADGEEILRVRDEKLRTGSVGIATLKGDSLFSDVEVHVLDKDPSRTSSR